MSCFSRILFATGTVSLLFTTVVDGSDPIRVGPKKIKPADVHVGERFSKVSGIAVDGRKFDLSTCKDFRATVIALTSTSCPICKKYVPSLAQIEKQFTSKNIQFCFLNSIASDKTDDIKAVIKTNGLSGPYLHDQEEALAHSLKVHTTAEVFVFDSAQTLVYRGAVDDQFGLGYTLANPRNNFLIDALNSIVAGDEISTPATTAPGCDLWSETESQTESKSVDVTYHNQVARIVQSNCVHCHREKGLAPFSLETADDLISHAGMIKRVVENGTMPPWFAAKEKVSRWANDSSLTRSNKENLLSWLSSERNLGDAANAPLTKVFKDEWNIGTPDKVYEIPREIRIQSTGQMPYKYAVVKKTVEKDTWIKAVEIRPTDPSVVHHVLVFARQPGDRNIDGTSGFFAAYVPGNSYQVYPEGFAKKLPAGSNLVFQLHYTPNGKRTVDQTKIGLKLFNGTPKHAVRNVGIAKDERRRGRDILEIPAGAENHEQKKSFPINSDVKLLSFMPHMHVRGKAFRYELVSGGKREMLLDVPRYDFNWQLEYRLMEPKSVRRGSKIEVTAWYDNSENNPANPDPDKTVYWGDQTDEEMMLGYVEYYRPNEKITAAKTNASTSNNAFLTRAFKKFDKNGDGKVTRDELRQPEGFNALNRNGDDYLTLEEVLKSGR